MMRSTSRLQAAAALLGLGLASTQADAAARTFVSGSGTDSGTCTRAAPCRTLAYAVLQTSGSGEVYILDSAGYGSVTITRAISIVNDGAGTAGMSGAAGGDVITINAGAGDAVHLRGLSLDGTFSAYNGVVFNAGGSLDIANCVFRNFVESGIDILPSAGAVSFSVSNTITSDDNPGIFVGTVESATVKGVISHFVADHGVHGVEAGGAVDVTIVNSVVSDNSQEGIYNYNGAVFRLARTLVTGNFRGLLVNGIVYSYGDNDINGNTNGDVTGSPLDYTYATR